MSFAIMNPTKAVYLWTEQKSGDILQEKDGNRWDEKRSLFCMSKNQRKARLVFARKYRKFTADSSETLSLAMSALNIFSIFPTLKTISYWAQRRVKFRHRTKLMEAPNAWFVANRPRPHSVTFYPARTYCNGRVFHYKNPWERSEASLQ